MLFIVCLAKVGTAQQELSLHFVRDVQQINFTNPALFPEEKINFSLLLPIPGGVFNFANTGFTYNDVFVPRDQDDSLTLDIDNAISKMRDNNFIYMHFDLDLLTVGFKIKPLYFTLGATQKFAFNFKYTNDFFDLLWNGNGAFVGDTMQLGLAVNAATYMQYYLGVGYEFDAFTVGAKFKYLNGIADFSTQSSDIGLATSSNFYELTFTSDYIINTSGLVNPSLDVGKIFYNEQNPGYAIDIGATYNLNNKYLFAASVIDWGVINWKDNVENYRSDGTISFDGISVSSFVQSDTINLDAIFDTLAAEFGFDTTNVSYKTKLTPQIYISGRMKLDSLSTVGLLLYGFGFDGLHPAVTVAIDRKIWKVFTPGLTWSYKNRSALNFGFSAVLNGGPFQMYFIGDNLIGMFYPRRSKNIAMRFGINWAFGKVKTQDIP